MASSPPGSDAPNWETLAIELHCPRCGYDLRRLPQPRCPECGLEFRWDEVLAAAQQRPGFAYFEYCWRQRPLRSFFATLWRALLPWHLWTKLPVAGRPRMRPLLVLLALGAMLYLVPHIAFFIGWVWFIWQRYGGLRGVQNFAHWSELLTILAVPWARPLGGVLLFVVSVWLVLQIFRQTIGRHNFRRRYLLRVLILASLGLLGWTTVARSLDFIAQLATGAWPAFPGRGNWAVLVGIWPARVVFPVSVCIALSVHLQVHRGWLLGLVALALALVLPAAAVLLVTLCYYDSYDNPWTRLLHSAWPWVAAGMEGLLEGETPRSLLWHLVRT